MSLPYPFVLLVMKFTFLLFESDDVFWCAKICWTSHHSNNKWNEWWTLHRMKMLS